MLYLAFYNKLSKNMLAQDAWFETQHRIWKTLVPDILELIYLENYVNIFNSVS